MLADWAGLILCEGAICLGFVSSLTGGAVFDCGMFGLFVLESDIAVAAGAAMEEFGLERILIVDLDVHQGTMHTDCVLCCTAKIVEMSPDQAYLTSVSHSVFPSGDGNAKLFENEPRVTTFSIHGGSQVFPLRKQVSDYDVALAPGVENTEYLRILSQYVPGLLRRHDPQLVFFQAGVDALASDSLGTLSLTRAGLSKRNNMVYDACLERDVPLIITLGGGYSRPIDPSVDAVRSAVLFYNFECDV